ncbi:uncharacterized protein LOC119970671 [Scyliorhinus canicula]|uniref:uncharacterized protein LOC119970671 n=1 Tax=Scyliorhinus canicula TaxID=7830 RepID=UPI0018F45818|nr:uncharacterized protein LOC119970671 [Scyliorhinus canicula]
MIVRKLNIPEKKRHNANACCLELNRANAGIPNLKLSQQLVLQQKRVQTDEVGKLTLIGRSALPWRRQQRSSQHESLFSNLKPLLNWFGLPLAPNRSSTEQRSDIENLQSPAQLPHARRFESCLSCLGYFLSNSHTNIENVWRRRSKHTRMAARRPAPRFGEAELTRLPDAVDEKRASLSYQGGWRTSSRVSNAAGEAVAAAVSVGSMTRRTAVQCRKKTSDHQRAARIEIDVANQTLFCELFQNHLPFLLPV